MTKITDKNCVDCGVLMIGVDCNKKYCKACLHKRDLEYARISRARRRQLKKENPEPPKPIIRRQITQLERDCAEADRMGMSYGMYKLMMSGVI